MADHSELSDENAKKKIDKEINKLSTEITNCIVISQVRELS